MIPLIRWTARAIGTAVLLLIAAFAIGQGLPNPLRFSTAEALLTLGLLAMVAGLIVGWWRELAGGLLLLGGFAFFAAVNGGMAMNMATGPLLAAGVLYTVCGWLARGRRQVGAL